MAWKPSAITLSAITPSAVTPATSLLRETSGPEVIRAQTSRACYKLRVLAPLWSCESASQGRACDASLPLTRAPDSESPRG